MIPTCPECKFRGLWWITLRGYWCPLCEQFVPIGMEREHS